MASMRSTSLLALFALHIVFIFLFKEAAHASPTSKRTATQEVGPSASGPPELQEPAPKKQRKKRRPNITPYGLPQHELDMLSFKDLVQSRPVQSHKRKVGMAYKDNFARHPQVSQIDLHDEKNPLKTVQALLELQKHGDKDDPKWKKKLTASTKEYIKEAPLDNNEHRQNLLGILTGKRQQNALRQNANRYKEKMGLEGIRKLRRMRDKKVIEKTGLGTKANLRKLLKERPNLNLPLSLHLEEDATTMTALEVEQRASELSAYYTDQSTLTRELEKYLKLKTTPPDQYEIAMAKRSHRMHLGQEVRRAQYKKLKKAGLTMPRSAKGASTEPSGSSTSVPPTMGSNMSNSRQGLPTTNEASSSTKSAPRSPSQLPPPPPRMDFSDPAIWAWLGKYLKE